MLLSGLKRHMRQLNPEVVDILSEKDPKFAGLRGVRDTEARELRKDGISATVKHTDAFTLKLKKKTICRRRACYMLVRPRGC